MSEAFPRRATAAAAAERGRVPLGVSLVNPLNVERASFHGRPDVAWRGLAPVQPHPRFLAMGCACHAYRVGGRILLAYRRRGVVTVARIVAEWAPAPENDPERYAWLVRYADGDLGPGVEIAPDARSLARLAVAMTRVEVGAGHPFLPEQAVDGASLALAKEDRRP